eukprot:TRINITY_DN27898_c0_g1_i1.p1 TRINITY_DN27898_c0_g1~~TRINITY_DN27898_c0_g1_i1.p1  ORF type:complete len:201 (+),score=54.40 TRINITY_DN27898_c0_g1_i1:573-1175(+)
MDQVETKKKNKKKKQKAIPGVPAAVPPRSREVLPTSTPAASAPKAAHPASAAAPAKAAPSSKASAPKPPKPATPAAKTAGVPSSSVSVPKAKAASSPLSASATARPAGADDMEDIFSSAGASAKKAKRAPDTSAAQQPKTKKRPAKPVDADETFNPDSRGTSAKARKTSEDGYKMYRLEELVSTKGGDTPDCPFDCQCCF